MARRKANELVTQPRALFFVSGAKHEAASGDADCVCVLLSLESVVSWTIGKQGGCLGGRGSRIVSSLSGRGEAAGNRADGAKLNLSPMPTFYAADKLPCPSIVGPH